MYSVWGNMACPMLGFPIRRFPDQSLLTAPRNLSQSSTSFIGNIRLGIHLVPLSTFLCIDLTSNCYSQFLLPSIKNSISSHKLLTFSASLVWAHSSTRKIHASGLHSNSWIVSLTSLSHSMRRFLPEVLSNMRVTVYQLYSSRRAFAIVFCKIFHDFS